MSLYQKIFNLALKQHPLSIALVVEGIKPSIHCLVKVPKSIINQLTEDFSYIPLLGYEQTGFYAFPRWLSMQDKDEQYIQFMLFNDRSLETLVTKLNLNQSSFNFESGEHARLVNIGFYKLARTKKNWDSKMKQAVTVICGLSFGFPEHSTVKFGEEVFQEKMEKNRIGYEIKGEKNLVFIGYPDTKNECELIVKKWQDFQKSKKYSNTIASLKLIKI